MIPFHAALPNFHPWLRSAVLAANLAPDPGEALDAVKARLARDGSPHNGGGVSPEVPLLAFVGFVSFGSEVYDLEPRTVDRLLDVDPPEECPPVDHAFAVELPPHPRLVWEGVGPYAGAFVLPPNEADNPRGYVGRYVFGARQQGGIAYQGDLFGVAPPWASIRSDYGDLDRLLYALVRALSDRRLSHVVEFPRSSIRRQRLARPGVRVRRLTLTPDAYGVWETRKIGPPPAPVVVEDRAAPAAHLVHEHHARYWVRYADADPDAVEVDADGFTVVRPGKHGLLAAVRRPRRAHVRGKGDGAVKVTRVSPGVAP